MSKIKVLSEDLIGKIAAGEVVERPASVIKELVENSIDAGAREVIVSVEDGGKKQIMVMDDGCGMDEADAKLCIMRHATSKISTDDDLNAISTLGFRGEALPSISAVSKLTIETKNATALAGTKLVIAGGNLIEAGDLGCPTGTKICVDDLFFNTPARKKFLKSSKTEEGHIIDTLNKLAITFPEVRFKMTSDGKEKLSCLSVGDPRARLLEVFGGNGAATAVAFSEAGLGINVHGFLGDPNGAGRISQGIYIFVNKRFIRDRVINHAVMDGYRSRLPNGCSPFAIVFLEIDPTRVDVNVHPTKQEVRFDNSGAIHGFVASAVRKAVQIVRSSSEISHVNTQKAETPNTTFTPRTEIEHVSVPPPRISSSLAYFTTQENLDLSTPNPEPTTQNSELRTPNPEPTTQNSELRTPNPEPITHNSELKFNALRVIGQLANSYILCEGESGNFVAIDQHAAHERIGFEKLKIQFAAKKIESQQLLIPEQVELQAKESVHIQEYLETLNELGLEMEPFGGKTFIIKSIPSLLSDVDIKALVLKLSLELSEIGHSASIEETSEHILKTFACHKQVRANHKLSEQEMKALLVQMDEWPNTDRCPHGRPTFIEFKAEEVGRWFKRG